jgi:hypothetical protein
MYLQHLYVGLFCHVRYLFYFKYMSSLEWRWEGELGTYYRKEVQAKIHPIQPTMTRYIMMMILPSHAVYRYLQHQHFTNIPKHDLFFANIKVQEVEIHLWKNVQQ